MPRLKAAETHYYKYDQFTQDETGRYMQPDSTNVLGDFGYSGAPVNQNTVAGLVLDAGGTGALLDRLGYERGTREYKSAQRAVQRHLKGTTPKADWKARYEGLIRPPRGHATIKVSGTIRVSEDERERDITMPVDGDVLAALSNPLDAWYGQSFHPEILDLVQVTVTFRPY